MRDRLVDFILKNIDIEFSVILEASCGEGQLTIPLIKKIMKYLDNFSIIAYDLSAGSYSESLQFLEKKIKKEGFQDIINIVQGDVRNMVTIEDETIDFIFSNDLFCDLDRIGLEKTLTEFYRILKPNGQMAHAEYAPVPENPAQKLFIEADTYSLETSEPKPDWFSPTSDEIAVLMHKIGFKDITIKYLETVIHMSFKEAVKAFEEWTVDPKFIEKHKEDLRRYGTETPIEHVIFCSK
ncbi:MAG: class I SAM-dependent methyltransferase [Candidatus Thorarchaeota archaeon]